MHETNLSGADFTGADLHETNLSGADLSGANLSYAYLGGADLRGANLSGAELSEAELSGAELSGAELRVPILQLNSELTQQQVYSACSDPENLPRLPSGFKSPPSCKY